MSPTPYLDLPTTVTSLVSTSSVQRAMSQRVWSRVATTDPCRKYNAGNKRSLATGSFALHNGAGRCFISDSRRNNAALFAGLPGHRHVLYHRAVTQVPGAATELVLPHCFVSPLPRNDVLICCADEGACASCGISGVSPPYVGLGIHGRTQGAGLQSTRQ